MPAKYASYAEIAKMSGIKVGTLYAFVSQGKIPHVRLGPRHVLFEVDKVMDWIETFRVVLEPIGKNNPDKEREQNA